ncbi:hypothetical protein QJQ45_027212 [Haematococcus lacustris]|nr:hypothetical protein QJQ45_027212 [Haematococcus lacustris]
MPGHAPGNLRLQHRAILILALAALPGLAVGQDQAYPTFDANTPNAPPAPPAFPIESDSDSSETVAALLRFPYCRCDDYRCSINPYRLNYVTTINTPTTSTLRFRINRVANGPVNDPCYKAILANLGKIEISIDKACGPIITAILVNGVQRSMYYDDEFAQGKVRATALNFNRTVADRAVVDIRMNGSSCNSLSKFGASQDGSLVYAMMESSNHRSYVPEASRWRLKSKGVRDSGDQLLYSFELSLAPSSGCAPAGYRQGNCCDATLDTVVLSLVDGLYPFVGSAYYTLADGSVRGTFKLAVEQFGVGISQYPLNGQVARDFFVTNFTDPLTTYTLTVPISKASGWTNTQKFPCRPSALSPGDEGACDYQVIGSQTVPGNATSILGAAEYNVPNCCPNGVVTWFPGSDDTCCIDNLAENPYRLMFMGQPADNMAFDFTLQYSAVPSTGLPPDPAVTNCSTSDVDQILLFVDALSVPAIQSVLVGGAPTTWLRETDPYRAWIRILNLHHTSTSPTSVTLQLNRPLQPAELCTASVATSTLCEYVLRGNFETTQSGASSWSCCPHGTTPAQVVGCPPTP